jgi:phage repressor protein C with HTH and peptisase S24 domain
VLKRIYNRPDAILCKSNNNAYDDFEVPKEDIYHIALVVGAIRLY